MCVCAKFINGTAQHETITTGHNTGTETRAPCHDRVRVLLLQTGVDWDGVHDWTSRAAAVGASAAPTGLQGHVAARPITVNDPPGSVDHASDGAVGVPPWIHWFNMLQSYQTFLSTDISISQSHQPLWVHQSSHGWHALLRGVVSRASVKWDGYEKLRPETPHNTSTEWTPSAMQPPYLWQCSPHSYSLLHALHTNLLEMLSTRHREHDTKLGMHERCRCHGGVCHAMP